MENKIGNRIKDLRKSKRLTLKDISEKTDLSISFLSQVERLKSSLTLESLKKISEALGVNPSYFFKEEHNEQASPIVRGVISKEDLSINPFVYKDLSGAIGDLPFSPILVVLNPGDNNGNPFSHEGIEFLYVLEGVLTVVLNENQYDLSPNDSIIIGANQLHYWINNTENKVQFLCISSR